MLSKQELIQTLAWEGAVTAKVIRALPEEKLEIKPSAKSRAASELIHTLLLETQLMLDIAQGKSDPYPSTEADRVISVSKAVSDFERVHSQLLAFLQSEPEEKLNSPHNFYGRQTTRLEGVMSMLYDVIHHRGQLSVYVRIAGGKMPSIYGPSGDEEPEK
jgi:uncharacterized damage-inducible protein DinB